MFVLPTPTTPFDFRFLTLLASARVKSRFQVERHREDLSSFSIAEILQRARARMNALRDDV